MELIFLNALLIGAGLLIGLFIRALPRVDHSAPAREPGLFDRWLISELPYRLGLVTRAIFLRALRRLKAFIAHLDSSITEQLHRMKLETGEGIPKKENVPPGTVAARPLESLEEDTTKRQVKMDDIMRKPDK